MTQDFNTDYNALIAEVLTPQTLRYCNIAAEGEGAQTEVSVENTASSGEQPMDVDAQNQQITPPLSVRTHEILESIINMGDAGTEDPLRTLADVAEQHGGQNLEHNAPQNLPYGYNQQPQTYYQHQQMSSQVQTPDYGMFPITFCT